MGEGATGRVIIATPNGQPDIDERFIHGEAPVQIEIQEGDTHRNILADEAEIVLTVHEDKVSLNLNMEGTEDATFDEWMKREKQGSGD